MNTTEIRSIADDIERLCDDHSAFGDGTKAVPNTELRPLISRLRDAAVAIVPVSS